MHYNTNNLFCNIDKTEFRKRTKNAFLKNLGYFINMYQVKLYSIYTKQLKPNMQKKHRGYIKYKCFNIIQRGRFYRNWGLKY